MLTAPTAHRSVNGKKYDTRDDLYPPRDGRVFRDWHKLHRARLTPQFSGRALPCSARRERIMKWSARGVPPRCRSTVRCNCLLGGNGCPNFQGHHQVSLSVMPQYKRVITHDHETKFAIDLTALSFRSHTPSHNRSLAKPFTVARTSFIDLCATPGSVPPMRYVRGNRQSSIGRFAETHSIAEADPNLRKPTVEFAILAHSLS